MNLSFLLPPEFPFISMYSKLLHLPSRWCFLASCFVIIQCLPLVTCLRCLSLSFSPDSAFIRMSLNPSQPKLSALGAGVRSVEKVDSRGPSSWEVCLPVCKCTHPGPFRAFPKGAISTPSSPLWYCFPNEPEQWSTGWPILLVKNSCWLSLESSGGRYCSYLLPRQEGGTSRI